MSSLFVQGKSALRGSVAIMGSKNAALPLLAATLLTEEECVLENVPRITDVVHFLSLMESMGVNVQWQGAHTLSLRAQSVDANSLNREGVKQLRGSVLLFGALLARCGDLENVPEPGGCIIGNRPLDTHFRALEALGAHITVDQARSMYTMRAPKLKGTHVILPEFSVTATENLLLAAATADGVTEISLAAQEPHVMQLVAFLQKMGVKITIPEAHRIRIEGTQSLKGARVSVIPDSIEAGTFAIAALVSGGDLTLSPVDPRHLESVLTILGDAGAFVETKGDSLRVRATGPIKSFSLKAQPYPGFPTDLQAPFGLLATQAHGTSLIHDTLFEGRFGYAQELNKMGARIVQCDPHRILVTGPTALLGREIPSLDLRAGATLLLAGLIAEGTTIIHDAEVVDRGYEKLDERLVGVGARIKRAPS